MSHFDYSQVDLDYIHFIALMKELTTGRPVRFGETGAPVTEPTDVFRIEMPTGRGPFNSDLPNRNTIYEELVKPVEGWPGYLLQDPAFLPEQMGITEVAFGKAHGDAHYGCESLVSINTWFPRPSRDYLAPLGAKIVRYTIPTGGYLLRLDAAGEVVFNKYQCSRAEDYPVTLDIAERLPVHPDPALVAKAQNYLHRKEGF